MLGPSPNRPYERHVGRGSMAISGNGCSPRQENVSISRHYCPGIPPPFRHCPYLSDRGARATAHANTLYYLNLQILFGFRDATLAHGTLFAFAGMSQPRQKPRPSTRRSGNTAVAQATPAER